MASSEQLIGYRFGSFVLNLEWGSLFGADGKEIQLRPKSFALLRLLVEHPGRILSQDAIMVALWPNLFVTENNITQCIREIRLALGPAACSTLQTLHRRGYRFATHVTEIPKRNPPTVDAVNHNYGGSQSPSADAAAHCNEEFRL